MTDIVITEADHSATRSAQVGDTLVIRLPELPTTGFRWAPAAVDPGILEQEQDGFQLDDRAGVGGGGLRVLRFSVKGRGTTNVRFTLSRSWEASAPMQVLDVAISVT